MIVELTAPSAGTVVAWARAFVDCRLCWLLPCLSFYLPILTCVMCCVLECAGGRPLFQDEKGNPLYSGWTGFDCSTPICVQVTAGLSCGVCVARSVLGLLYWAWWPYMAYLVRCHVGRTNNRMPVRSRDVLRHQHYQWCLSLLHISSTCKSTFL
jgi:hypothetical protein